MVRLQPRPQDPYRWVVSEALRATFRTNLSSGSVGQFRKIRAALEDGDLIEAVPPHALETPESTPALPFADSPESSTFVSINGGRCETIPGESFTTTIRKLKQEKEALSVELDVMTASRARELAEAQASWDAERHALHEEISRWKSCSTSLHTHICQALESLRQAHNQVFKVEEEVL